MLVDDARATESLGDIRRLREKRSFARDIHRQVQPRQLVVFPDSHLDHAHRVHFSDTRVGEHFRGSAQLHTDLHGSQWMYFAGFSISTTRRWAHLK